MDSFAKHHKAQAPAITNALTVTTSLVSTTDFPSQTVRPPAKALSVETRMRPKLLADLPPKLAALIEDVTIDNRGRLIPLLFSKLAASKELRCWHSGRTAHAIYRLFLAVVCTPPAIEERTV